MASEREREERRLDAMALESKNILMRASRGYQRFIKQRFLEVYPAPVHRGS